MLRYCPVLCYAVKLDVTFVFSCVRGCFWPRSIGPASAIDAAQHAGKHGYADARGTADCCS